MHLCKMISEKLEEMHAKLLKAFPNGHGIGLTNRKFQFLLSFSVFYQKKKNSIQKCSTESIQLSQLTKDEE